MNNESPNNNEASGTLRVDGELYRLHVKVTAMETVLRAALSVIRQQPDWSEQLKGAVYKTPPRIPELWPEVTPNGLYESQIPKFEAAVDRTIQSYIQPL
jgi:hypothetical protein